MDNKKKGQKRNRYIRSVLVFVLSLHIMAWVVLPTKVEAIGGGPVVVTADIPAQTKNIGDQISQAILQGLLGSLVNMASYFMRTLAYDTASYIASGGQGQGSLIFEKPFDEYLGSVAKNSVGEGIASLGQGFGVNLCAPPDLRLQAQLKVGLDRIYNPATAAQSSLRNGAGTSAGGPQASCSWQQLKDNWSDGVQTGVDINAAADFASEVNVVQTDFGYALGAFQQLEDLKAGQEQAAQLEAMVGQGFKSVTDVISGHINTPANLVKEEATSLTGKHQGEQSTQQIAGLYASSLWQVIPTAASVFLNTLTSQLLNRLFTDGLVPSEKERGGGAADFYAINSVISQRQIAQRAFSFLTSKTGVKDIEYNMLAEFSVCPNNPGLNNCVMNDDMKNAINRALVGKPLTLYDAVFVEHYISPNTPLISPRRTADNESTDCYKESLCYSNIQKMRKARILPLGMEIAAQRSNPDKPWTIGEVLLGFEDCPPANQDGSITPDITNHPFCHLINPNWVLRAPDTRCENQVYSPELLVPESPRRREECVDVSTCITEDENGNCVDDKYYGFCTQEKNVWFFPGDTCDEQFASCKTYTNQETNTVVSYLSRTLEYGSCNENAVGCLPYVTEKKPGSDEWVGTRDIDVENKLYGSAQVLYLNDRVTQQGSTCPEEADGCNQFIGAERNPETGAYIQDDAEGYIQDATRQRNIKKAPSYLGCYDTNTSTLAIEYPTTQLEIASLTDDARCDAYASVCLPEEVGCEAYTPADGGEAVPGVVGDNFCPASCVGYNTFRQEETPFEASQYPLYFIPTEGDECSSQHVGCDEFTNIGDVSQGGERLEYYSRIKQCETPTGDNSSVYYSWEGSESTGFILRVHTLAKVGDNTQFIPEALRADFTSSSPAYADDSSSNLLENDQLCNETLYRNMINKADGVPYADPDCRALYDTDGTVYYRLLAETVTVSSACHPLRKTESRLTVTGDITDASTCTQKKGYWDGSSCQVCFGGGDWVPDAADATQGSCVYYAIDAPGESVSCPASANACREYVGNAGNNTKPVFETGTDTFEPNSDTADSLAQAKAMWGPEDQVSIAPESLQVNFNSLRINGGSAANVVTRDLSAGSIESGSSYELTFWARGTAQTLSIYLKQGDQTWSLTSDPLTDTDLPISISQTWRSYTVGPVLFTGDATQPLELVFERAVGNDTRIYFLDNVSLKRTDENRYIIRDSWKTAEGYDAPAECFADNQDPRGAFPGAALGCSTYTTSLGQTVHATGFERLCREKAVGCAPLWDTYNTQSPDAELYNVQCIHGTLTQTRYSQAPVQQATTCEITVGSTLYNCTINAGESACTIPGPIAIQDESMIEHRETVSGTTFLVLKEPVLATPPALGQVRNFGVLDASSIYVPADTPLESPVFLTDSPEYACKDTYLGCQITGLEEQRIPDSGQDISFSYTNQGIINLPANYVGDQGILCTQEQVACSAFTTSDGGTSYFKDPSVNANKLCVYQEPQANDPTGPEGWFLKYVGHCSQDANIMCDTDAACGDGNTCVDVGESEPCYPNYQTNLESYGLWSNGSAQYDGYVGECPATQNLCTELVDPYDVDTSGKNPDGKPYYVIYDDRVTGSSDECGGQASLREGCVLFDNTEIPTKSFDVTATYNASEARAKKADISTLVPTVSTEANDANVLLKVHRNRECSEWLACESYEPIQTGDGRQVFACESFGRCVAFDASGACAEWATDDTVNNPDASFLDLENYISRDTSWNGAEYTGYSLYNRYNLGDLETVTFSKNTRTQNAGVDTDNSYLGYILTNVSSCESQTTGEICGPNSEGRCIEKECVVPVDGIFDNNDTDLAHIASTLGEAECKVPPEQDSPYSSDVVPLIEDRDIHGFANDTVDTDLVRYTYSHRPAEINVCQGGDCTCDYIKVSYGSLVKDYWASSVYHQKSSEINVWGICTGSFDTEGDFCREDSDCGVGTCRVIDRIETQIGSTGHCLEYDLSRPLFDEKGNKTYACLTWYPSDKSFGQLDNYNLFSEAGYAPYLDAIAGDGGAAGKVYCTESFGRGAYSYEGTLTTAQRFSSELSEIIDTTAPGNKNPAFINIARGQMYKGDFTAYVNGDVIAVDGTQYDSCESINMSEMFYQNYDGQVVLRPEFFYGSNLFCRPPESGDKGGWQEFDRNPYMWYVCGLSYGDANNTESSCSYSDSNLTPEKMDALYSLASLFSWQFIGNNATVLRVEGDDSSFSYGYEFLPPLTNPEYYAVNGLVPVVGPDARNFPERQSPTLLHPPRFGASEGSYTFDYHAPCYEGGCAIPDMTIDTRCMASGQCIINGIEDTRTNLRSSDAEAYLNLQSLDSVYFVPLRIPLSSIGYYWGISRQSSHDAQDLFAPAMLSTDLRINFNGTLGTNPKVAVANKYEWEVSSGLDKYTKSKDNNIAVTTYKLKRDTNSSLPCDGLISFCDYEGLNDIGGNPTYEYTPTFGEGQNPNIDPRRLKRNEVDARYVMVYYRTEIGHEAEFATGGQFNVATSLATDPFSADCKKTGNFGYDDGQFFAIGMDFNKEGEFLGYITKNCAAFGLQLAVVATMKDQCSEFASVYKNVSPTEDSNKAWTNRVWNGSLYMLNATAQQTPRAPFGSSELTHDNLVNAPEDGREQASLLSYAYGNPILGYPLSCEPTALTNVSIFSNVSRCTGLNAYDFDTTITSDIGGGDGTQKLSRLFATYYALSTYPFNTVSEYEPDPVVDAQIDSFDLIVPQIYSLNPETCFPNDTARNCSPGQKNNVTVGENNGDEPIIAKNSYTARTAFFAFADDNRMPIRRVMINWGDGDITNENVKGYYKNRKPYCEPNNEVGEKTTLGYCKQDGVNDLTLLTCNSDTDCPTDATYSCIHTDALTEGSGTTIEDVETLMTQENGSTNFDSFVQPRFGNLPRACVSAPFEYYHTYGCQIGSDSQTTVGAANISEATKQRLRDGGLTNEDKICVYQPKVQILDNWGYCNGSCNGTEGCYNDESIGAIAQCDDIYYAQEHWTSYDGVIIVTP